MGGKKNVYFSKILNVRSQKRIYFLINNCRETKRLKTITRVCFRDYCYKNCKIDSGTEYKNFNWTIFQTIRAITCFLRDPKYRGYCSAKRQLGINRVFTTREEEFFMWIIFFENNGRRMFATCAYPGFGNDYVSRGFLWIEDS